MQNEYKTKTRYAIIEYLKENADRRFTARDIVDALAEAGVNIDRSTIYRNLERLCGEGKLVKYKESAVNATCYQYTEGHDSCNKHMHAQCEICGRIFHLDSDLFEKLGQDTKKEYGIEIDYGKTVIICRCSACKKIR